MCYTCTAMKAPALSRKSRFTFSSKPLSRKLRTTHSTNVVSIISLHKSVCVLKPRLLDVLEGVAMTELVQHGKGGLWVQLILAHTARKVHTRRMSAQLSQSCAMWRWCSAKLTRAW